MNSSVKGNKLVLERVFQAPVELVFQAYSEPDRLEKWWGPEGWETKVKTFEFMPNGVWHYGMTCVNEGMGEFYGMQSWGLGIFQSIEPMKRIQYKDMFSDAEGMVNEQLPMIDIDLRFIPEGKETKLVIESEFESEAELQKLLEMQVIDGMTSQFNCLDQYLAKVKMH
ncbi:SRPBCC domain-containing protein [Halobacillus halophilus]|uniref:SRPBCC family protein n=1 Tax=Halobacillus halophilus TaxID=1570 RepID=UPI0013684A56|nr:SRPBCC domain-containing protein [Halobacillus halophilus]MYL31586.1 SRPBCC domain-containing protein [Halobacillus halophilus]